VSPTDDEPRALRERYDQLRDHRALSAVQGLPREFMLKDVSALEKYRSGPGIMTGTCGKAVSMIFQCRSSAYNVRELLQRRMTWAGFECYRVFNSSGGGMFAKMNTSANQPCTSAEVTPGGGKAQPPAQPPRTEARRPPVTPPRVETTTTPPADRTPPEATTPPSTSPPIAEATTPPATSPPATTPPVTGTGTGNGLIARENLAPGSVPGTVAQLPFGNVSDVYRAGDEATGRYFVGPGCAAGATSGNCLRVDVIDANGTPIRQAGTADINRLGTGGVTMTRAGDLPGVPEAAGGNATLDVARENRIDENNRASASARDLYSERRQPDSVRTKQGDCVISEELDADGKRKFNCGGTKTWIEGAKIGNQVSQAAGQVVVGAMGQSAQQNAAQSGTQSGAMESAANLQAMTAKMQMGLGATNAMLGALQLQRAQKHKKNAFEIETEIRNTASQKLMIDRTRNTGDVEMSSTGLTQTAITAFGLNNSEQDISQDVTVTNKAIQDQQTLVNATVNPVQKAQMQSELASMRQRQTQEQRTRTKQLDERQKFVNSEISAVRAKGQAEQRAMGNTATQGGMMSAITGLQQLTNAFFGLKAANEMKKAAKSVQNLENVGGTIVGEGDPVSADSPQAPTQGGGAIIGGDGTGLPVEAPQTAEEDKEKDELDLGAPRPGGDGSTNIALPAPTAGEFTADAPKGGAGGGGGPAGGASVSGSGIQQEGESSARQADNKTASSSYGGGGGGGTFRQGGAAGGGDGGGGPDLAGMFAQFLPKPEEANGKTPNILDYGTAPARLPASMPDSLLDRKANLFERISKALLEKTQRGFVGTN